MQLHCPRPNIEQKKNCKGKLDFYPSRSWPKNIPGISVNQIIIAGVSEDVFINYNLEPSQIDFLLELLKSAYTTLSFSELCRLTQRIEESDLRSFSIQSIFKSFGFNFDEQVADIKSSLLKTPIVFQKYCDQKQLAPQDLRPLLLVTDNRSDVLLTQISGLNCSKSTGTKMLEIGTDLLLMGHEMSEIMKHSELTESWLQHLESLRYPLKNKIESQFKESLLVAPQLPQQQLKFVRNGDRLGIEIKAVVHSSAELSKYAQSLKELEIWIKESSTSPWPQS